MTTGINFNQIPSAVSVPLFYLEINSTATVNPRTQLGTLLFGISTGDSGIEGEVISVGSAAQAGTLYGQGSQLSSMVEAYRANDRYGPLTCIGLSEGASWRAASKLIKFEGTPNENGSVVLYVGGRRIAVPAVKDAKLYKNSVNDPGIIDSIVHYVNGREDYPFTATGGGNDEDQELYIPLPIHPTELTSATAPPFDRNTEHDEPIAFIQPGAKYKKDPRNTESSSIYYVPADNSVYGNVPFLEYTAGKYILINKSDSGVRNRNNKSGTDWTTCVYDSTFGSDVKIEYMWGTGSAWPTLGADYLQVSINAVSNNALRGLFGLDASTTVNKIRVTATLVSSASTTLTVDITNGLTPGDSAGVLVTGDFSAAFTNAAYTISLEAFATSSATTKIINSKTVQLGTITPAASVAPAVDWENSFNYYTDGTSTTTKFYGIYTSVSSINYPGDVNDDSEWYIPLPIHPTAYAEGNKDSKFGTSDQHTIPTAFIQPGRAYKLDPRNTDDSSTYYVASENSTLYRTISTTEYTAPGVIAVNPDDNSNEGPDNPNYAGTTAANLWDARQYSAGFNGNSNISDSNYPGDPPSTLVRYFAEPKDKRRGLVSWLLAFDYVLFTSKWQGEASNGYDVRGSINPSESIPKGLTVTGLNENFTGGAGDLSNSPEWQGLLDRIGDSEYLLAVHPENGRLVPGLGLTDYTKFFGKLIDRWDYISQLYGHGVGAIVGDQEAETVISEYFDAPTFSSFYFGKTPTPAWECAAALGGAMINQVRGNPKLPYNDIEVRGVVAPALKDRPSYRLRERLLRSGISTTTSYAGRVYIERPVTGDPKWRDLSRRLSAAYIAVDIRDYVISRIGRSVIGDEGTVALPGSGVVTPAAIKSIIVVRIHSLGTRGYIENFNEGDVSVQRDLDDPTRVNIGIAVDPTNPLYVFATRLDIGN